MSATIRYHTRFQANKMTTDLNKPTIHYNTRFQAKKEYFNNMKKLQGLLDFACNNRGVVQIKAIVEMFEFLQTFQLWKDNARFRQIILQKIDSFFEEQLPIVCEKALQEDDNEMLDAIYNLEKSSYHLEKLVSE